jgi:hypothetical protein
VGKHVSAMDSQAQRIMSNSIEAEPAAESYEIDFSPPEVLTRPLWKSLIGNLRDRMFPEELPPLEISSRPINLGMLLGDFLSLPWYRTVFTNLGDVVSPETLPPLELESRPVEVRELISDQMSHFWWTSLLRNLADAVAPEHLPPLLLSSSPVNASLRAGPLQVLRWSSLASWPKARSSDKPTVTASSAQQRVEASSPVAPQTKLGITSSGPAPIPVPANPAHVHGGKLKDKLSRSRMREGFWISIATAEIIYLFATWLGQR